MRKKNTLSQKMPWAFMVSDQHCPKLVIWSVALILLLSQFSCALFGAPIRAPQNTTIYVEVSEIPEVIKRGEDGAFEIKTIQNSICLGTIFYTDLKNNELMQVDLSNLQAGPDGKCKWIWPVPVNAKTGTATFRAAVDQAGLHGFISPQTFCIDMCPWGHP